MEDGWITAAEAYARVKKLAPFRAAETICNRAHDGIIFAKAQTLIIGDKRAEDIEVPAEFWWAGGKAALTQNWSTGDFETWIDRTIHCRAYGVTFLERDIAAMVPPGRVTAIRPNRARQGNYAASSRCVAELQTRLGCTRNEAADQIVRFCRAGLIESRCASFWHEVTKLIELEEEELEQVAIPPWFWEHCAIGPDAILDWQSGNFAGRGLVAGQMHKVRIRGAEFDVGGIIDLELMLRDRAAGDEPIAGALNSSNTSAFSPIPRGGRSRSENWTNWIAELVCLVHDQGIPDGSGADGQDALIGMIEERLAEQGLESLGRSTVQAAVRAVLIRLRSAGN